ncbi:MAG: BPL-N domain-containing protein [Nitrospirota bacterium]
MPSEPAAFLWDESFLWGLLSFRALRERGLAFRLVSAGDIRRGRLREHRALYVPGGWATNKMKSLGQDGVRAVTDFVRSGGTYVGICGGAGLATREGMGLVNVRRKPLSERVPSLSGPVRLRLSPHPLWEGVQGDVFHIWWPSQFVAEDEGLRTLASFEEATADAFTSDINVGDTACSEQAGWAALEERYALNLDPRRMKGDPLVLVGSVGAGRVFLSLVHFDTPGDENGGRVLANMWGEDQSPFHGDQSPFFTSPGSGNQFRSPLSSRGGAGSWGTGVRDTGVRGAGALGTGALFEIVEELFEVGVRNFLWFRRGPLIQWRRGVRGLEYFTLYEMVRELSLRLPRGAQTGELVAELRAFAGKASGLLLRERRALDRGERLTFREAADPGTRALREELFSRSKSHGGLFKRLLEKVDRRLYALLGEEA